MEEGTVAIKVRFMGDLRAAVGQPDMKVSLPQGSTVGDLVTSLCNHYGDLFRCRVVSRPGTLHHDILVFLDGENIEEIGGLAGRVEGASEMEIIRLPMFEGG